MAFNSSEELLERLYSLLPRVYRNSDEPNFELKRFLDVAVSGGLYPAYRETRNLLNLIDFDSIPAEYLPYMAGRLGFAFPYDLDERTQRTYIKNAVASYKIKGTERALTFMIRELTRFKTELVVNKKERTLDIILEVDLARQDFEQVVKKVDFLVREYAPPLKSYNLINTFLWFEKMNDHHFEDRETITIKQEFDLRRDGWFGTGIGTTNNFNSVLVASIERYAIKNRAEEVISSFRLADQEEHIGEYQEDSEFTVKPKADYDYFTLMAEDSVEPIYLRTDGILEEYTKEIQEDSINNIFFTDTEERIGVFTEDDVIIPVIRQIADERYYVRASYVSTDVIKLYYSPSDIQVLNVSTSLETNSETERYSIKKAQDSFTDTIRRV